MDGRSALERRMLRPLVALVLCLLATLGAAQVTWKAEEKGGKTTVVATIEPGWHLYSTVPVTDGPSPTDFTCDDKLVVAREVTSAERKLDKNFGKEVAFFSNTATFEVDGPVAKLAVGYQVCNDRICHPPKKVALDAPGEPAVPPAGSVGGSDSTGDVSAQVAQARKAGILPFLGLAFGFGLLALLTPCVFPMIPITVSYFSKEKERGGKPVASAIAFCLGIVGTYTVFGVGITAIFGASSVNAFGTNPWVNLALGALFIYLALNLFGLVQIQLPGANRVSSEGKGGLIAPAIMGFTFTLTSFTCAVGFVGAVLAAAATGELLYPILGMLAFSAAFALPFFLLALFPALLQKLPRAGAWMETVKATMGFIELMAALKFLSNADLVKHADPWISRSTFLVLWGLFALAAALWLFGIYKIPTVHSGKIGSIRRGFGVAFAIAAGAFFLGVAGRDLRQLEAYLPQTATSGSDGYDVALKRAKEENKLVLINFTGVTCTNCRLMEKYIFPTPEVKPILDGYVVSELYTDRQTPADRANRDLQLKLGKSEALPLYVLVDGEGKVIRKFEGSTNDPNEFARFLKGA